jgi:tetrahydrodipicolinate N-succinyltransferase
MKKITFISPLDSIGQNRLRVHLQTESGMLKDVMYQYETLINDQWIAIVRYDCAHGFFHRDVLFSNGDKEKQTIEMDSLKSASKYAEQDLKDRWEWYRERYMKTLKK